MATSLEVRRKVAAALSRGETIQSIAERFEIGPRTVGRIKERIRDGRPLEPDKTGPKGHVKLTDADVRLMRDQIKANPGITLLQLRDMLSVRVAESTVCRAVQHMRLSFKKSR